MKSECCCKDAACCKDKQSCCQPAGKCCPTSSECRKAEQCCCSGKPDACKKPSCCPAKGGDSDDDLDFDAPTEKVQIKLKDDKKKKKADRSTIVFEVMPSDAETDLTTYFETYINKIQIDGLVWSEAHKIVPGPFGLKKLQFGCCIEDEKVSVGQIENELECLGLSADDRKKYLELKETGELDDYDEEWPGKVFGSVNIASFQKL